MKKPKYLNNKIKNEKINKKGTIHKNKRFARIETIEKYPNSVINTGKVPIITDKLAIIELVMYSQTLLKNSIL